MRTQDYMPNFVLCKVASLRQHYNVCANNLDRILEISNRIVAPKLNRPFTPPNSGTIEDKVALVQRFGPDYNFVPRKAQTSSSGPALTTTCGARLRSPEISASILIT